MKDEFNREFKYCLFCKATTAYIDSQCISCLHEREKLIKYSQVWTCSKCNTSGAVEYVEDEGIERVANRIVEDHRAKSSFCLSGISGITVHKPIDVTN